MYTATVLYEFEEESFTDACRVWEEHIMDRIQGQDGFVRMQFLTAPPRAMAIGTWEAPAYARAFMQTGVFKELLETLGPMLKREPKPQIWDLACFAEA